VALLLLEEMKLITFIKAINNVAYAVSFSVLHGQPLTFIYLSLSASVTNNAEHFPSCLNELDM